MSETLPGVGGPPVDEEPPLENKPQATAAARPPRLWTRDFAFLWQGQLVSSVGDVVYEIALGFWVLAVTGSTALMGTLMATTMIPRVLLGPFAGVWVDRSNRKTIMIVTDLARGVAVVAVAVAAFFHIIEVWMVFAAGIVIGVGGAFFGPSVLSAVPDIVPRERIVQGNSFFQMIQAGSGIVGNSGGGILYAALGAPLMFLVNGLSYLFSSSTVALTRIPHVHHRPSGERTHFFSDMKDGLRYVWNAKGLRLLLTTAAFLNFFAMVGIVLFLPLFQRTSGLGPTAYGIAMGSFTFGMLAGMSVMAAVKIPAHRRPRVFVIAAFLFTPAFAIFPAFSTLLPMALIVAFGGFFNAVVNVLLMSVVQITVPSHLRGKVMGLLSSITGGLSPIGMAVGGILGEFFPVRTVISASFIIVGVVLIPISLSRSVRSFFAQEGPADMPAGN